MGREVIESVIHELLKVGTAAVDSVVSVVVLFVEVI